MKNALASLSQVDSFDLKLGRRVNDRPEEVVAWGRFVAVARREHALSAFEWLDMSHLAPEPEEHLLEMPF